MAKENRQMVRAILHNMLVDAGTSKDWIKLVDTYGQCDKC